MNMVMPKADVAPEQGSKTDALMTLKANPLRIGISTRALFDLEGEHRVFEKQGVQAYVKMQREREDAQRHRIRCSGAPVGPEWGQGISVCRGDIAVSKLTRSFSKSLQGYRSLWTYNKDRQLH